MQEVEADCFQAKELQASAFSRERATIQSECEAEVALLRAEVAACELQVRGRCIVPNEDSQITRSGSSSSFLGAWTILTFCLLFGHICGLRYR